MSIVVSTDQSNERDASDGGGFIARIDFVRMQGFPLLGGSFGGTAFWLLAFIGDVAKLGIQIFSID